MKSLLIALSIVSLVSCSTTPEHIITKEIPVYITPPREIVTCSPPIDMTDDFIKSIENDKDYNEKFVLPTYLKHEECHKNSQDLQEWINTHKSLEVANKGSQ